MNGLKGLFKGTEESPKTNSESATIGGFFSSTGASAGGFFSSVAAKGDGLFSNLSNKLGGMTLGSTEDNQDAVIVSSGNNSSSASEYGDGGDKAVYNDESDPLARADSIDSLESLSEENAKMYRKDIADLLRKLLELNPQVTVAEQKRFQGYLTHHTGRSIFAKKLRDESQFVHKFSVQKGVFDKLAEYMLMALKECEQADDMSPATILMQISFLIYHEEVSASGQATQHFLFTRMRELKLWKSIRFWNAAFFIVISRERAKAPKPADTS
ncbi:hypothetical protein Ciccas_007486 [Cichlidogyrus casuarinus]|uniref:SBF1/SBF2 domain-containing protein n=1 Tax=Cichlidogyrus casuarinus TaxID=1844966 RepID=A0ABD2Q2T1_9PLAT